MTAPVSLEQAREAAAACSIDGCASRAVARSMCGAHWKRWRKWGDPTIVKKPAPLERRIFHRCEVQPNGCLTYTGHLDPEGYGKIRAGSRTDGTRRTVYVHRAVYIELVGPVPEGLQLDHLCRTRSCCNPAHLEPVTARENTLRAYRRAPKRRSQPAGEEP